MNDYRGFDLAQSRGSRLGSAARRAIRLGLCLVLFAGVAVACGGSKSSGQSGQPANNPAASVNGPAVTFDTTAFSSDGGGYSTNGSALEDAGYTDRYQDLAGLDHMAEAYAIILNALPKAVDLNQVKAEQPGTISCDVCINWQPMGRRDTALPPGNHGERIYEVDIDLGPYLKNGDSVAYVWFLSRADAASLDPIDLTATPQAYPSQAYTFTIDKATAGALFDIFWVKGAAPTNS